jgi:CCR4-NOT transcription complex subunit 9
MLLQVGLNYICATAERFFAVGAVLGNMVVAQASQPEAPSQRLLKHIIRCYLRLSDNPRAREALRSCLPELLRNAQFTSCLKNDDTTRRYVWARVSSNVQAPQSPSTSRGALPVERASATGCSCTVTLLGYFQDSQPLRPHAWPLHRPASSW